MQGHLGNLLRKHAVGLDRSHDIMGLRRHHHIVKAALFEMAHVVNRRGCKLLGQREIFTRLELFVKRTGVHAHTNGNARLTRGLDHSVGLLPAADVARVDAQFRGTAAGRLNGDLRIEMNVRHHGKGAFRAHLLEGL